MRSARRGSRSADRWTGIVLLLPVHHGRYRILQRFLYSPFGIAGVETLGYEIATQCREKLGKDPDVVVCTNAGGGMVTGTARGLLKAGCKAEVVAASIDLTGLSMASDVDFNKKSCTTGHTGFGVPLCYRSGPLRRSSFRVHVR